MSGFTEDAIALPGHVLQPKNLAPDFVAGKGTYLSDNGELRSSIVGKVKIDDNVVSVVAHASSSSSAQDRSIDVSDRVHGRVVKVMTNQVIVEVLAVNNIELRTASKGVIRREDVRTTETDQILMQDCFRPGDIVIAAVTVAAISDITVALVTLATLATATGSCTGYCYCYWLGKPEAVSVTYSTVYPLLCSLFALHVTVMLC